VLAVRVEGDGVGVGGAVWAPQQSLAETSSHAMPYPRGTPSSQFLSNLYVVNPVMVASTL
jgi:hypothetical protein